MVAVWIHLLVNANWEDKPWRGEVIPRGSLVTSIHNLAVEVGLSDRQIRYCLERLANGKQIVTKGANKWTKITICNYATYQDANDSDCQTNVTENGNRVSRELSTTKEYKNTRTKEEKKDTNVSKEKTEEENASHIPPSLAVSLWNQIVTNLPKVRGLSSRRQEKVRLRIKEFGNNPEATMRELFAKVNASAFLCKGSNSEGHKNWRASFDWVFENDNNWMKIIEGQYDNNRNAEPTIFPEEDWRNENKFYYLKDFDAHPEEKERLDHTFRRHIQVGGALRWGNNGWRKA